MEYNEALDIVAQARTHYQAFEKMDEVLKKAQGAENHVKELEQHKTDLQSAIEVEQNHLEEIIAHVKSVAKEFESRINQLKEAEAAATQKKNDAIESLDKTKAENHRKFIDQTNELQAEFAKTKSALEDEVATLRAEAQSHQQNIARMKELARSVA